MGTSVRDGKKEIIGYTCGLEGYIQWRQKVTIHCTHSFLQS